MNDAREDMDLIISIGTLDNYDLLSRCLDSVYQESPELLRYEVWIVYNGPGNPALIERIRSEYPRAKLFCRIGPLGYCATHNLVLNQAVARYILILDDDTEVPKGTLSGLVTYMDRHPDAGIAGCKTLNPDGTFQNSYGLLPSLKTEFLTAFKPGSFWPARIYRDISSAREVEWLNGSFMLIRRETLQAVGALDERYYTYGCEADWCYRIHKAGWKVMYVPEREIVHVGGTHSINTSNKRYPQLVRYHVNRFYFFHKHYGSLAVSLLRPIMLMGALTRLALLIPSYLLRRRFREPLAARIRAFLRIARLCFERRPQDLTEDRY